MLPSIDPEAYLDLARELANRSESAATRTAADRAYYAAFLTCRDMLAEKGHMTPYGTAQDHRYVAETLKKVLGASGNDEHRLRRARNTATYETGQVRSTPSVDWMIATAQRLIDKVKNL